MEGSRAVPRRLVSLQTRQECGIQGGPAHEGAVPSGDQGVAEQLSGPGSGGCRPAYHPAHAHRALSRANSLETPFPSEGRHGPVKVKH